MNFSVVFGLEKISKDTTFQPQNIEKKIIYETYFMRHTLWDILYETYFMRHTLWDILYETYYMRHTSEKKCVIIMSRTIRQMERTTWMEISHEIFPLGYNSLSLIDRFIIFFASLLSKFWCSFRTNLNEYYFWLKPDNTTDN